MSYCWLTGEDYPEREEVNILYNVGILFLFVKLRHLLPVGKLKVTYNLEEFRTTCLCHVTRV